MTLRTKSAVSGTSARSIPRCCAQADTGVWGVAVVLTKVTIMSTRITPLGGHGVVTRTDLLASGMKRAALEALIENGDVVRLDRSRFALPGTDPSIVTAVSEGGTLTCLSALKLAGVSVLDESLVHLRRPTCRRRGRDWAKGVMECRLPPRLMALSGDSTTIPPELRTLAPSIERKKRDSGPEWPDHPLDGIDAALRIACTNHTDEELAVVLDSLLCTRLRTRAKLHTLLDGHSKRAARLVGLANAGSESVLESVVRHRLVARGITVQTQVRIPDLGRVDMLLGKSLILETDGYAFHADRASFCEDRRRDRIAVALGYAVIRLTWEQVFSGWPQAMADISAVVATRRHLRSPRASVLNETATPPLPRAV